MKILLILLFTIILLPFASAHFPYIVDSKSSASDPVIINDIHRSQVWYFDQKKSPECKKFTVRVVFHFKS